MVTCFPSSSSRACGSELLSLIPIFKSGITTQILFLKFIKDGPADLGDKFVYGGSANQNSDTARICRFLVLPGISVFLFVSILLLRAS